MERPQADIRDGRRGRTTLTATSAGAPSHGEGSRPHHQTGARTAAGSHPCPQIEDQQGLTNVRESLLALSWSRGDNDEGAITLRQVERTPGTYDVEVETFRPVPPLAAMLFSEAVHHLRSAVDNVVFYAVEEEHGQPLTLQQERSVSMLVYDDPVAYERKWKGLVRQGLAMFDPTATIGTRIESLQPFNDSTSLGSLSPMLSMVMGVEAAQAHPLALLRDYSNEDKHRTIRLAAGRTLVQRHDDWQRSVGQGMRHIEVGTVLEQVPIGVPTPVEISPGLHVDRPDGTPVPPSPELDGMARHEPIS